MEQVARNSVDVLIAAIFFRLVLLQYQQAIQGNDEGSWFPLTRGKQEEVSCQLKMFQSNQVLLGHGGGRHGVSVNARNFANAV